MGQIRHRSAPGMVKANAQSEAPGDHRSAAKFSQPPFAITISYPEPLLANTSPIQELPSTSCPSYRAADARRRKSARELFEQYGIGTPSGWLSDEEDLSFSRDGNASPQRFCRVCHVCSARTWSSMHCPSCRHRLCEKCLCEVPEHTKEAHVNFSHHPSRTIKRDRARFVRLPVLTSETMPLQRTPTPQYIAANSKPAQHDVCQRSSSITRRRILDDGMTRELLKLKQPKQEAHLQTNTASSLSVRRAEVPRNQHTGSLKQNPFIIADKTKAAVTGPRTVQQAKVRETRYRECSQHNSDSDRQAVDADLECDDAMCRATHKGHYPYRHSISCTLYRSEQSERATSLAQGLPESDITNEFSSPRPQSTEDPSPDLNQTIHRHHSVGFHGSHHIAEHLEMAMGHGSHISYAKHAKRSASSTSSATSFGPVVNDKVEPSKYLEPLTPIQAITRVDSFHYSPDVVSPGHPGQESYSRKAESLEDMRTESRPKAIPPREQISSLGSNQRQRPVKTHGFQNQQNHHMLQHVQSTDMIRTGGTSARSEHLAESSNAKDQFVSERVAGSERNARPNAPEIEGEKQSKTFVPKGHLLSPPSWLKTPRRDAGNATSRLRHIDAKNHQQSSHPHAKDWKGKEVKRSKSSTHKLESARDSFSRYTVSNQDLLRVSAPSPTTAIHVTHHQRPGSWYSPPSGHMQSKPIHESSVHRANEPLISDYRDSPQAGSRQNISRFNRYLEESVSNMGYGDPPSGVSEIRVIKSRRSSLLSPSWSHLPTDQSSEHFKRFDDDHQHLHRYYANTTPRAEARPSNLVAQNSPMRDTTISHLSATSDGSQLPPQPPRIILEVSESPVSRSHSSILELGSRWSPSFASDLELHRPTPVAPPNHQCSWKDRYLALTAEIRQLKAEMSTRASLRGVDIGDTGNQDENLGLLGVTIVMHLKDRDDLVINTDLTQDFEDNTPELAGR
ncbi:hypothetical protein F4779DRAFT_346938 [Xylariaceae sp. FL0662B]|nr:hypothetical protein F4779DRAFT_346938 [Xylariaceae sp. FL0662B]